tara:strand:- start:278 stop:598 length:321 start_codon:yes stop_codon:yes gene_type:complete
MAKRDTKMSTAFVTPDTLSGSLSDVLRRKLASMRKPYAALADRYGWGTRKAKAVYQGTLCPTAADLLNLMANDDDVFAEVLKLTGRDGRKWDEQAKAIRDILEGNL